MKLSRYTQTFEYDGKTIIYNLMNDRRAVCIDPNEWLTLKKLCEGIHIEKEKLSEGMQVFCVDESIDERKVALGLFQSSIWTKQHLSFIVLPTMDCMFRCKYCYEDKNHQKIDNAFMGDFLNAIKKYHETNTLKTLSIEWYGGEPLLMFKEIKQFTQMLNDFCSSNNIVPT